MFDEQRPKKKNSIIRHADICSTTTVGSHQQQFADILVYRSVFGAPILLHARAESLIDCLFVLSVISASAGFARIFRQHSQHDDAPVTPSVVHTQNPMHKTLGVCLFVCVFT